MTRRFVCLGALLCLAVAPARGELEELFSRHVRVFRPLGPFAARLIRVEPPAGPHWKRVEVPEVGLRLSVPAGAAVETARAESRVLLVRFPESEGPPKATLRVDAFPRAGEERPPRVDPDFVETFVEQFPEHAVGAPLKLTDRGHVLLAKKTSLALAGGTYPLGAALAYRLQWVHLAPQRQLVFTFDCAEHEWERLAEPVARLLLSLELEEPARAGR